MYPVASGTWIISMPRSFPMPLITSTADITALLMLYLSARVFIGLARPPPLGQIELAGARFSAMAFLLIGWLVRISAALDISAFSLSAVDCPAGLVAFGKCCAIRLP